MKKILTIAILLLSLNAISQDIKPLEYKIGDKSFKGYYAMPERVNESTKTILIVHEWWGLNDYPRNRAIQLAKNGFIAVCIDMYGTDIVVDNPKEAGELAGALYANPVLAYQIFTAGLEAAKGINGVHSDKMAAIGYCFGGNIVLNAAKMGAPLDAIVSFHGGLSGPRIEKEKLVAAILICNGEADTYVPQSEIKELIQDMDNNGVNYKFINYEGAQHAFTNPRSTYVGKTFNMQISYNEEADKKSFQDFLRFIEVNVN